MQVDRRKFLKLAGGGSLALLAGGLPVMAGPFDTKDIEKLVPSDKKLHPDWVKSLFERGAPQVYAGAELEYIGMPVGGLCSGQLYLGGDGRLWHWDLFNQHIATTTHGGHYADPLKPDAPLRQGFSLHLGSGGDTRVVELDRSGFADVRFRGEYPIGIVDYKDPKVPLAVTLEAFSPFTPLSTEDSSLPATVLRFTVRNVSQDPVEATLAGHLENAVCRFHRDRPGMRSNRIVQGKGYTLLNCTAVKQEEEALQPEQPDAVFEDWNRETYATWTVEGTAFGKGPVKRSDIPSYQGDVGGEGDRVVNSHAAAPGDEVGGKDAQTGKLVSRPFKITHRFVKFWIGGGTHAGRTCLNLVVGDKVELSAVGADSNRMSPRVFDVRAFKGREARLEIVDAESGGWGNIGVGRITFSDQMPEGGLENLSDYGSMGLALMGAAADLAIPAELQTGVGASAPLADPLVGALGRTLKLSPGQSQTVTFALAWHFPNLDLPDMGRVGRYYASRFASAEAVAAHLAEHLERLSNETRLWRDTWYDSTLPYWFLDRTLLNASILATSTSHRFKDGRFYGWEGVGCCAGTCTHVWHYEQAMGRLFPELDILLRERADFNPKVGFRPDGLIDHRGEHGHGHAIDGQAGTILRAYRDHQVSPDRAFLDRNWPAIKKAMEWMMSQPGADTGVLNGAQHNTLDAAWYGPVAWLSGLYLAALRAAEEMAREMGDAAFAQRCRDIIEPGAKKLVETLFNGEYFNNQPDPNHPKAINSGTGCHIDQVFGQGWAFQTGLGRILPEKETRQALASLWKYNFAPDVGPYRKANKPGRWYAMAGEAGLLMCTFPRADWDYFKASGQKTGTGGFAGYFNECMNGFEYQAAGHMIWEGMVMEGLAITRAVHDRYHASRRNPWNEIECGDHYARSMASYGVYLAACGFEYDGPKGHLGFAPRLTPENFKCAFTGAEGWGSFRQQTAGGTFTAEISVRWGRLTLKTISLAGASARTVRVSHGKELTSARLRPEGDQVLVMLENPVTLNAGEKLTLTLT